MVDGKDHDSMTILTFSKMKFYERLVKIYLIWSEGNIIKVDILFREFNMNRLFNEVNNVDNVLM